jgi:hypothetical protein
MISDERSISRLTKPNIQIAGGIWHNVVRWDAVTAISMRQVDAGTMLEPMQDAREPHG